jgi:uncharacterized protein (DUF2141 family)
MKKLSLFFLFFILPLSTFAQYSLTVEITGLRNNKGDILYELFDQNQKNLKVGTENISNNKCVIVIDNLKP